MKRTLIILPVAAIALYLLGGWLQSIHGFDPPYQVFSACFAFQLASVGLALVVAILLAVAGIRVWLRWRK